MNAPTQSEPHICGCEWHGGDGPAGDPDVECMYHREIRVKAFIPETERDWWHAETWEEAAKALRDHRFSALQTYAAGQLVRASAHMLREAMGELARATTGDEKTDADYELYNRRCALMNPAALDALALELENEAARI